MRRDSESSIISDGGDLPMVTGLTLPFCFGRRFLLLAAPLRESRPVFGAACPKLLQVADAAAHILLNLGRTGTANYPHQLRLF